VVAPLVYAQPEPVPTGQGSPNDLILTDLPKTESALKTWRDRVSAARATDKDTESQKKLQETLNRLRAVRFADPQRSETQITAPSGNSPVADVPPQTQDNKPIIIVRTSEPRKLPDSPNSVPEGSSGLTRQTAEALTLLAQSPEKILNPEAMADILFQSKTFPQAALYYEESLKRLNKKTMAPSEDKAWLLFQIGNSLQESDPEKAMIMYKQLISEHPHSLWAELVRIKGQCITWELREKPKALISEIKERVEANSQK
jgi:tetratricopeptide (TPR) repeat protein